MDEDDRELSGEELLDKLYFDQIDPAYRAVRDFALLFTDAPPDEETLKSFDELVNTRTQELLVALDTQFKNPLYLQRALLYSISTFVEAFRLNWILDKDEFPPESQQYLEQFGDYGDGIRDRIIFLRSYPDMTYLSCLASLLLRSYNVTVWLLPIAGIESLQPLAISAACKRIVDHTPVEENKRRAADLIDDFVWALETLVESEMVKKNLLERISAKASLCVADVWPWAVSARRLPDVANHLARALGKRPRTIKGWSTDEDWKGNTESPDNREVWVEKDRVIQSLRNKMFLQ